MYILHINHIMMSAPCNYFVNVNVHICLLHIYLCLHLLRCHCKHLICQLIWNLEDTRGPNYLDPRNSVTSFLHQCLLYPWQYSHYRDELDAHNPQSAHYNLSCVTVHTTPYPTCCRAAHNIVIGVWLKLLFYLFYWMRYSQTPSSKMNFIHEI